MPRRKQDSKCARCKQPQTHGQREDYILKSGSQHYDNLLAGFHKARHQFTDVTLLVGERRITAHKFILVPFSPYFEALFCSDMMEGKQEEVVMRDLKPDLVEQLVEYAYTGSLKVSPDTVQDLLQTANFLGIEIVQQSCVAYIEADLDMSNCVEAYNLGRQMGVETLSSAVVQFLGKGLAKAPDSFKSSAEWLNLPASVIGELLQLESIQCTVPYHVVPTQSNQEEGVLNLLLKYVNHNESERLPEFPNLIKNIRLPILHPHVLDDLKTNKLVKKSPEALSIVEEAMKLTPQWDISVKCQTSQKPRDNKLLTTALSKVYRAVAFMTGIDFTRINDADTVPELVYVTGMTIFMRDWHGQPIWGGYEVSFSNGDQMLHGRRSSGRNAEGFTLLKGETITGVDSAVKPDRPDDQLAIQIVFYTSKKRMLGPFGGNFEDYEPHDPPESYDGFLVGTRSTFVHTRGAPILRSLMLMWAFNETSCPDFMSTHGGHADEDADEGTIYPDWISEEWRRNNPTVLNSH